MLELRNIARAYKSWNKCFGIGMNKTATSSLNCLMSSILGFRSRQSLVESSSTIQAIRGNYRPLLECMDFLDFHQDLPCSQGMVFVALDALFPASKFILTVRESSSWAESFIHHYGNHFLSIILEGSRLEPSFWLFRGYQKIWLHKYWREAIDYLAVKYSGCSPPEESSEWIDLLISDQRFNSILVECYDRRNDAIIAYFRGRPSDCLVIDISKQKDIAPVCDFLEIPVKTFIAMPKINMRRARGVSGKPDPSAGQ